MADFHQPDEMEIRAQLRRILSSAEFRDAPVISHVLRFIVESALDGKSDRVNASIIAREALGKDNSFRSSIDPSVRVAANRMRRTLRLYYADQGSQDDILISVEPGTYEPIIAFRTEGRRRLVDHVLKSVDHYQTVATPELLSNTLTLLESALANWPEDPVLLAAKAELLMDSYKHGQSEGSKALDDALDALEIAASLEPENAQVLTAKAFAALIDGDASQVESLARNLAADSNKPKNRAFGVWALTLVSDDGAAMCNSQADLFNQAYLPGWIHHAPYLAAYCEENFELALNSAMSFGMEHFYWSGIDRAAVLGQLGLRNAAQYELDRTLKQCPALRSNPDITLRAYIPRIDTREAVLEGLEKAGLESMQ